MLNLAHNRIERLEGLKHLDQLVYLDMSSNKLSELDVEATLPTSITIIKLNDNPIETEDPAYRKKCVVGLQWLTEMDKIKVVAAERLVYLGLMPASRFNIKEKLEEFKREKKEAEAKERMEFELYVEMHDERGITSSQRITENLQKYAALDGEEKLQAQFGEMMHKMKGAQGLIHAGHKDRFALIEKQFDKVLTRYPGSAQRRRGRATDREIKEILEEKEGEDEDENSEEDEEDDEANFNQYSLALDSEVKRKLEKINRDAAEEAMVSEAKLSKSRGMPDEAANFTM